MSTCRHPTNFLSISNYGYLLFPISTFQPIYWVSRYPSHYVTDGGCGHLTPPYFICNDINPKIIEVEFDTGSLQKNDVWHLCEFCSQKYEFQKFRLNVKNLKDSGNKWSKWYLSELNLLKPEILSLSCVTHGTTMMM